MTLIVGQLATADGATMHYDSSMVTAIGPDGERFGVEERSCAYSTVPARNYRMVQPHDIPVDVEHSERSVGELIYAEQGAGGLMSVLDVDEDTLDVLPIPFFLSAETRCYPGSGGELVDIELLGVALVGETATVGKSAARIVTGGINDAHTFPVNPHRSLLKRAADYHRGREYSLSAPHRIAPIPVEQRSQLERNIERNIEGAVIAYGELAQRRRRHLPTSVEAVALGIREIEYRSGGRIISVR